MHVFNSTIALTRGQRVLNHTEYQVQIADEKAEAKLAADASKAIHDAAAATEDNATGLLCKLNLILGFIHLVTGAAILVMAHFVVRTHGFVPVYYSAWNRPTLQVPEWTLHLTQLAPDVQVFDFIGLFLLLSAADHISSVIFRARYELGLRARCNHFRWFEYSLSLPVMSIVIGLLCGALDAWMLATLALLSVLAITVGWTHDAVVVSEDERNYFLLALGWFPFAALWALTMMLVFDHAIFEHSVPNFVWAVLFTLFALESCFGFVSMLEMKYTSREVWYCMLSLVAKQLLAWITFSGVMSLPASS